MRTGYFGSLIAAFLLLADRPAVAQQYNSDSWIAKPHGTITLIPMIGQRNSMIMATYSLIPDWEFTHTTYLYNRDQDRLTDDGRSSAVYAKWMFYDNRKGTGGASVKFGTGISPGLIKNDSKIHNAFKTYFVNFPCTVPFFDNHLSWDIMPGISVTRNYGEQAGEHAAGITYSTRAAFYPFDLKWSVVGEVFGQAGEAYAKPEYKIGVRWEPNYNFTWALSYGQEFNGKEGAGVEFGAMIFTPQFACFGTCKSKR